jgi:hypothetical protein
MAKKQPCPPIPLALLKELEERFPDRLPDSVLEHTSLADLIGQQKVIRFLRREFEKQNNPKEV